jgi:internalin A
VQIIYEAKLLLVGEGEAGKTSLAQKIIDRDYQLQPTDATQGIDILTWEFTGRNQQQYRINIWDFGGQSIYHQTHRFFLTQRSLYLLVADSRKENTDHYWWLQNIQVYGQDSPVLLIQNEKNDCNINLDYPNLRKDFLNLKETQKLNLADNRGLPELETLLQQELEKLIGNGLRFPRPWAALRQTLVDDQRKYITLETYKAICREQGITDEAEMLELSQLLHDLGVFLHFQERDSILYHQIIIDRKWGTDAVYKILTNPAVKQNLGRFNDSDLQDIWQAESETSQRHELLELMKKFKVCYEIPRKPGQYIAPHLLEPEAKTYEWLEGEAQPLVLHYDYKNFMPKGMMTRFIVEMHQLIENASEPDRALVWRSGVVLQEDGARTEAIEHYQQHRISIRAIGSRARNLINKIQYKFQEIHESFNLQPENYGILIPCKCETCLTSDKPFTFSLETLHRYLDRRRYQIECHKSGEDVEVRSLIDNVIAPEPENLRQRMNVDRSSVKKIPQPQSAAMTEFQFDIFICHSSKDKPFIIENILPKLKERGITYWIDAEQIDFGHQITKQIEDGLRQSRYLVPCLSRNLGTSNWTIAEYGFSLNAEFSGSSDQRVIPIKLDNCEDKDISPLLRDRKRATYSDPDDFNKFLDFLKK